MEDWHRAIAAKSDFPDAYFNLGVLLAKQGQPDRAREVFTACRRNCQSTLRPSESQRLDRLLASLPH
jgi:TolA-binding protein